MKSPNPKNGRAGKVYRGDSGLGKLEVLFAFTILVCVIGVVLSMFQKIGLKPSDGATLFAGLLAASIVWWQGHLIKQQMELQAMLDLHNEWNSEEMLERRSAAWNKEDKADKDRIEGVLEFLEKVSTLEKNGVISRDLIGDTFGWYVWRYYHYSRSPEDVIDKLREDWAPRHPDQTLYQDLEHLWDRLVDEEVNRRKLKRQDVIEELDLTRKKFISSEKRLTHG